MSPRPLKHLDLLTDREKAFVKEYLSNGRKASEAYAKTCVWAKAGSTDPTSKSCKNKANVLARKPRVRAVIEAAEIRLAEKTKDHLAEKYAASHERIIEELAKIAFTNTTDIIEWDENGVRVKNSKELGDAAGAVAEVTERSTKEGKKVTVKTVDKLRALEGLGKAVGLFKETESKGPALAVQFVIEK